MKAARIVVLTSAHLCRNPRVVKEAGALATAGHDVTVLTVSAQARFERMDEELMRGQPFRREVINYAAPRLQARLADLAQRGSTWAARWCIRWLRLETAQSLGPACALLHRARRTAADLIIAHTEIPIWAAQHLIRDGRRVAVDIEDWYSEDLLYRDRSTRPLRLLRRAEAFALRRSRYVSTTSRRMAEALAERFGGPVPVVIRNTFPLQPVARADRPSDGSPPRFIWFSQTIGPGRGLELFFAAWARTTAKSSVFLLGDERPGYKDTLLGLLPAERRAQVRFLPLVPPAMLPGKLAEFDLGLALEPRWPRNRDLTISNKIFQYMNAGLAVVSSDTAGQTEVMQAAPDCGLLMKPGETTRLARQLDELLADGPRLRAMQEAARRAAQRQFCWERETPVLLAAVDRALSRP